MPNLWLPKHDTDAQLVTEFITSSYRLPVHRDGEVIGYRYVK